MAGVRPVSCPWCGYANRAGVRFCGDCGRSLIFDRACRACGSSNPEHNVFCDACGARFASSPPVEAPQLQAPAAQRQAPAVVVAAAARESHIEAEQADSGASTVESVSPKNDEKAQKPPLRWDTPPLSLHMFRAGEFIPWVDRNKWELLFVVLCTAVAAVLRIYRLADFPPGLHGDEAWTGIDALRILEEGWIGPYVGSALGQPTGPLYFVALVFGLSDATLFTVRLPMALIGAATVPLAYLLLRSGFGRVVAIFGTVALTFAYWHLEYSRTAFLQISVPLIATVSTLALLVAMRSTRRRPWFLAGLVLGAGIYTYPSYMMFPAAVAVVLMVHLKVLASQRAELLKRYALLALGALIIALPMIKVILESSSFFFSHGREVSLLNDPRFSEAEDVVAKARFVAERARAGLSLLYRHPGLDGIDGTGGRGALGLVLSIFAYIGLAIALVRWRSPPHLIAALAVLAGMSALVLATTHGGDMRRSLVAIPFVFGLAGVAAVEIARVGGRLFGDTGRRATLAAIGVIFAVVAFQSISFYFGDFVKNPHVRWVYAEDLVDSLRAAHRVGDPGTIYFYSDRWSYNYETRRFLYPETVGVDRSAEFGSFSLDRLDEDPVTYVLVGRYAKELDSVKKLYPGGAEISGRDDRGLPRFAVYHLE